LFGLQHDSFYFPDDLYFFYHRDHIRHPSQEEEDYHSLGAVVVAVAVALAVAVAVAVAQGAVAVGVADAVEVVSCHRLRVHLHQLLLFVGCCFDVLLAQDERG